MKEGRGRRKMKRERVLGRRRDMEANKGKEGGGEVIPGRELEKRQIEGRR